MRPIYIQVLVLPATKYEIKSYKYALAHKLSNPADQYHIRLKKIKF